MAKLIGTSPNQVPTNADLGSMAYVDKDNFDPTLSEAKIAEIARKIDVAAVDIFVYDTSKDSDGGAWRKRTQNTAWYKEGPSYRRSSRKEFPAIAVIVLGEDNENLRIYDGDDPDLPLWWWPDNGSMGNFAMRGPRAVAMKNGMMVVAQSENGGSDYDGIRVIDFIRDEGFWSWNGNGYAAYVSSGGVGTSGEVRIADVKWPFLINDGQSLNDEDILDVAMTVLPNAPIDPATGIAKPTVAIATSAGGIDVIKDSGRIVTLNSIGGYTSVNVNFTDTHLCGVRDGGGSSYLPMMWSLNNLEESVYPNFIAIRGNDGYPTSNVYKPVANSSTYQRAFATNDMLYVRTASGTSKQKGMYAIAPNFEQPTNSMHYFVNSTCMSGWQVGDSKLAIMCDTNTADLNGHEDMVAEFNTLYYSADRTTSVSYVERSNTVVINDDEASVDGYIGLTFRPTQNGRVVIKMVADNAFTPTTGYNNFVRVGVSSTILDTLTDAEQADLTNPQYLSFEADENTEYSIYMYSGYDGGDLTYTLNMYYADADRSPNCRSVRSTGTIYRTPVATGAELVGYSNFSSGRYLVHEYNPDLDFGTGDFSFIWWNNSAASTGDRLIWGLGDYTAANGLGALHLNSGGSGDEILLHFSGSDVDAGVTIPKHESDGWICIAFVRRGGYLYGYRNGDLEEVNYGPNSFSLASETIQELTIGAGYSGGSIFSGAFTQSSLALFRASASAPSHEQIRKIYETEKKLFAPNAKVTLYGDSDAVNAVDYDSSTNLLHAGTNYGRSVFQDMQRVENTTTAVATAISVSNGLVAEE